VLRGTPRTSQAAVTPISGLSSPNAVFSRCRSHRVPPRAESPAPPIVFLDGDDLLCVRKLLAQPVDFALQFGEPHLFGRLCLFGSPLAAQSSQRPVATLRSPRRELGGVQALLPQELADLAGRSASVCLREDPELVLVAELPAFRLLRHLGFVVLVRIFRGRHLATLPSRPSLNSRRKCLSSRWHAGRCLPSRAVQRSWDASLVGRSSSPPPWRPQLPEITPLCCGGCGSLPSQGHTEMAAIRADGPFSDATGLPRRRHA